MALLVSTLLHSAACTCLSDAWIAAMRSRSSPSHLVGASALLSLRATCAGRRDTVGLCPGFLGFHIPKRASRLCGKVSSAASARGARANGHEVSRRRHVAPRSLTSTLPKKFLSRASLAFISPWACSPYIMLLSQG